MWGEARRTCNTQMGSCASVIVGEKAVATGPGSGSSFHNGASSRRPKKVGLISIDCCEIALCLLSTRCNLHSSSCYLIHTNIIMSGRQGTLSPSPLIAVADAAWWAGGKLKPLKAAKKVISRRRVACGMTLISFWGIGQQGSRRGTFRVLEHRLRWKKTTRR